MMYQIRGVDEYGTFYHFGYVFVILLRNISLEKPRIPVVTQQRDDAGPFQLTVDEVLGELGELCSCS